MPLPPCLGVLVPPCIGCTGCRAAVPQAERPKQQTLPSSWFRRRTPETEELAGLALRGLSWASDAVFSLRIFLVFPLWVSVSQSLLTRTLVILD